MEFKDYYKTMGVERGATQDEIRRAYKKLARKYHPDVSSEADAEARFKEVGEAYEVLKDPEKRAAYDQLGMHWKEGQDFRPPPDWDTNFEHAGAGFTGADDSGFSSFFEELFGRDFRTAGARGARHRGFHARGDDHHARIRIDLEDSLQGGKRSLRLQAPKVDEQGRVRLEDRTINVTIPKGIRPGQHIRLAGQGMPGIGEGGHGDLYLEVEFNPHPLYRFDGKDLVLKVDLAPWEAALGGKVKVPTPGGAVDLAIPANARAGQKLRLKGRGLPGRTPGNLIVELNIVLPPADSERSKSVYREMKEKLDFNPRKQMGV